MHHAPTSSDWPYPRLIAHRGAGKLAPENTLAAFRLGAQFGYRMFECDAKLSQDGVVFLLHDDTLARTSNGAGVAGQMPWSALSRLDAGAWHSRHFAGEPLATMDAVARFCLHNHYALNIEIKPTEMVGESTKVADAMARRTGEVVAASAQTLWQDSPLKPLLSSFKPASLIGAKAVAPELPRGLLLDELWDGWLGVATELDCAIVTCNYKLWNKKTLAAVKAQGMRCGSYTVNDEAQVKRLLALGVDCIYTDRVDLFSPAP